MWRVQGRECFSVASYEPSGTSVSEFSFLANAASLDHRATPSLFQIERVEPLCEPTPDLSDEIARAYPAAAPAHRQSYFPGRATGSAFQIGTVVGSYPNKPRSSALR